MSKFMPLYCHGCGVQITTEGHRGETTHRPAENPARRKRGFTDVYHTKCAPPKE